MRLLLHWLCVLLVWKPSVSFHVVSTHSVITKRWSRSVKRRDTSVAAATTSSTSSSDIDNDDDSIVNPAVLGWPDKYTGTVLDQVQPLNDVFCVEPATEADRERLDVAHWPVWTTADKDKWAVGNVVPDKVMPYGELSYLMTGRLEITPADTNIPVVVQPGDFVTFPKGFVASWQVLEEVTWHYYLY